MPTESIRTTVVIVQTHAEMAPYVVVSAKTTARWKLTATTTVDTTIAGLSLGRRTLKRLDDRGWFLELRRDTLTKIGKAAGDRAVLVLALASTELPSELAGLIDTDRAARARWEAMSVAQQRMLREEILAAKTSATRERRARCALVPAPSAPPARVTGLRSEAKAVVVRIVARRLPGLRCGPYSEVHVGLVERVGCDPDVMVPADRREARWETAIEVREVNGAPAFRGKAVNGPPHERFLYLTWMGRKGGAGLAMFRRAKLRLDAVPAGVLAKALRHGALTGSLDLTAPDGMPVCASVRPPAIVWTA